MISYKGRRSKGRRAELEAKKLLEAAGWTVEIVHGAQKYNANVDMFGLWDLLALKGGWRKFIQVKCNRKPPFKEYEGFARQFGNPFCSFEVWVRKDNKPKEKRWSTWIMRGCNQEFKE